MNEHNVLGNATYLARVDVAPVTFEAFFEVERDRLLRLMCVVTGSYQEAEDIAQDAFLKLWERWERVVVMDGPDGYLYRTAFNLFRNRSRRAAVAARRAVGLTPQRDAFSAADDRHVVTKALASLPSRKRAALVLTDVLGYSAEEAGSLLGVKGSTVRALAFQGRSALRNAKELSDDR
jgi:RNA polymerase sigma-70 factor (ECF subfamily)